MARLGSVSSKNEMANAGDRGKGCWYAWRHSGGGTWIPLSGCVGTRSVSGDPRAIKGQARLLAGLQFPSLGEQDVMCAPRQLVHWNSNRKLKSAGLQTYR